MEIELNIFDETAVSFPLEADRHSDPEWTIVGKGTDM